ncbi:FkbM family methyltransferase [Actinokineospora bangkokensis]|uniref:Methyltransferase FkbM domain-containing protein n=1 Tax=Actinokineospora bangkokensis TaxID=1193682 RepID=A0A1Q9LJ94_9PSEU|nr:FkbM family methyltransferase [Actinokineospora bangkokensis]OLR92108.1 hypothetical protein BJP25_22450 [Actinokineospora bangkokensis]
MSAPTAEALSGPLPQPLPRPALRPTGPVPARARVVAALARGHAWATRGAQAMPVLAALDRLLPPGLPPVAATFAPGIGLRVDGALARGAVLAAGYEHREAELLAGALRPGGVFLDVGANVGWFSLLVAAHRRDAAVWAVEAVPATADLLAQNVAASGLTGVEVVRVAAGRVRGTAVFTLHEDSAYAHRDGLAEDVRVPQRSTGEVECPVVPLDEVWRERGAPRVDAVKVDVEGAELDALAGMGELLRAHRPVLVVEAPTEDSRRAVADAVRPLGYRPRECPGVLPYNAVFCASAVSGVAER